MAEEGKSAEQELKDAVWTWTGRVVMAAVIFGAGFFAAWFRAKDYPEVVQKLAECNDTIVDLKNERETLSTRIAREARDKEVCRKKLKELGK
ncbi:MAG: hypothetical protein ACE5D3_02120 [Candidatus Binatia bacterium]